MNTKIKNIILVLVLVLSLVACEQSEVMDYSLEGKVYFYERTVINTVESRVSEKNFSFALQNSSLMVDTFLIKVRLMGDVVDTDRSFKATVLSESSTAVAGTHYKLLDGVMEANEYISYLPVVLYRTDDTQEEAVSIDLEITDEGDLGKGYVDDLNFTLTWGDILLEPDHWPEYFFGVYSENKYRFAIDVLGLTDWPQTARVTTAPEEGVYTISEIQSFVITLNEAYEEYREVNGPIYVDDEAEVLEEIYYGSK